MDHLNSVPGINEQAILNASNLIREDERLADRVRIAAWHHGVHHDYQALDYLSPKIIEILGLSGFSLLLHGHLHRAHFNRTRALSDWMLPVVGAGTFGASSENRPESVPFQYNLLVVHRSHVVVHSRKRRGEHDPWGCDYDWGLEGQPFRVIELPGRAQRSAVGGKSVAHSPTPSERVVASESRPPKSSEALIINVLSEIDESCGDEYTALQLAATRIIRGGGSIGLQDGRFLFGRYWDLRHIMNQVIEHGANKCLTGAQWVGKTAFLRGLCDASVRAWVWLEDASHRSIGNVSWHYFDLRTLRATDSVELKILESVDYSPDGDFAVHTIGELAEKLVLDNRRLVLMLDHFDSALEKRRMETNFLNELRGLPGNSINIIYAITSEARIPHAAQEKAYYFSASAHYLDFFAHQETANKFMEVPLLLAGIKCQKSVIENLVLLGGRHPFFLSLARLAFLDSFQQMSDATMEEIFAATASRFDQDVQNLYDGLLARLKLFHHQVLTSLLRDKGNYRGSIPVQLRPFVNSRSSEPFSEHFRRYYLESYLPLLSDET